MLFLSSKARAENPEGGFKSWILRGAQDDKNIARDIQPSRKVITQLVAFDPIRLALRSTFPTVGKETVAKMGGFAVVILSYPTTQRIAWNVENNIPAPPSLRDTSLEAKRVGAVTETDQATVILGVAAC
jgi:hypothetical protein